MKKNKIDYRYKYARDFDRNTPKLLEYLFNGGKDKNKIDEMLNQGLSLVDHLFDCSDFRIEIFTRILCSYKQVIGIKNENRIVDVLTRFPFDDDSCHSMCTWTENHQLILDVSKYLLGNLYPTKKFYNGILGKDLASKAYIQLNDWIDFIFNFGFSEFGSCNYYPETLAALGNVIEFANDKVLVEKFKIVLDLMCFDIFSSATPDLTYNKATARAYFDNKTNYYNYLKPHILGLLGNKVKVNHEREACFFLMLLAKDKDGNSIYKLPKVFLDIFNSKEKLLKESNGLNHNEYRENGLLKYSEKNARYILTSGTSTNCAITKIVTKYIDDKKMWNHSMLSGIKRYRKLIEYCPHFYTLVKTLQPTSFANIAYARGNTYTYIKDNYSVSSLTRYQINRPSFQQVSHMINLDGLSVFTTSPATSMDSKGSPSYWIGSKVNPDCIQQKNILIVYYKNPKFTHIFFPIEKFDMVDYSHFEEGYLFARYHKINLVIKTNSKLIIADSTNDAAVKEEEKITDFKLKLYDLINKNKKDHYYIFEVNDTLSFKDFIDDVLSNKPIIKSKHINYKGLSYVYNKECTYKSKKLDIKYCRFESEYILGNKYKYDKNNPLVFISSNNKLTIDFDKFTRIEETIK